MQYHSVVAVTAINRTGPMKYRVLNQPLKPHHRHHAVLLKRSSTPPVLYHATAPVTPTFCVYYWYTVSFGIILLYLRLGDDHHHKISITYFGLL